VKLNGFVGEKNVGINRFVPKNIRPPTKRNTSFLKESVVRKGRRKLLKNEPHPSQFPMLMCEKGIQRDGNQNFWMD